MQLCSLIKEKFKKCSNQIPAYLEEERQTEEKASFCRKSSDWPSCRTLVLAFRTYCCYTLFLVGPYDFNPWNYHQLVTLSIIGLSVNCSCTADACIFEQ